VLDSTQLGLLGVRTADEPGPTSQHPHAELDQPGQVALREGNGEPAGVKTVKPSRVHQVQTITCVCITAVQRGDKGSASDRVGGGGSPPLLDASLLHLAHPCHRLRQPTALAPPHLPGRAQPLHRPLPPPLCVQVKTGSEGHRPPFGDNQRVKKEPGGKLQEDAQLQLPPAGAHRLYLTSWACSLPCPDTCLPVLCGYGQ